MKYVIAIYVNDMGIFEITINSMNVVPLTGLELQCCHSIFTINVQINVDQSECRGTKLFFFYYHL